MSNKMDPSIKEILKSTYTESIYHTHVSLIYPRGKFMFNRQTVEKFWDVYCKCIMQNNKVVMGIAERPHDFGSPVIADIDLKILDNQKNSQRSLYTIKQLQEVVRIYQSIMSKIMNTCTNEDLTCVVLEKNMYMINKNDRMYLKHGFHLHFPYCFLTKKDQEIHIIPRVKEELKKMDIFKDLGIENSGDIIDKNCYTVPWLLYGSRKNESSEPYIVTKIYNSELIEIELEEAFKHYQIFDISEHLISIQGKVKEYLPRILSIVPWGRSIRDIKKGLSSPLKEEFKARGPKPIIYHNNRTVAQELEEARQLLPMLSDFRADDRTEWLTVGWVLYNISNGHIDALDLWCEFSSRCDDKYDESECIYQWDHMVKKDLSIGTLRYYAKLDSPIEYSKFKAKTSQTYVIQSLEGSHNDVAKVLYEEYKDEFICGSVCNKLWFQFFDHVWHQIEDGVFLRERISGNIITKYETVLRQFRIEINTCSDDKIAPISEKIKPLKKIIMNLKSSPYKNNVMHEAQEVFYDPKFRDRLDTNPMLIAFANGVYDFTLNIFRPGRPEDYLSKSLPINYKMFSEDDKCVQEVYTFIEQVFPDKSLRKYFLDISSNVFIGGNHDKIVLFWTGEGDNGKSITQKFFELMLGKLAIKLSTKVITGKKPSAGSAFADLARSGGGIRWAVIDEPNQDETINTGTLKILSGGDSFYARDLFERGKDGREIQPLFKLVIICNSLPRITFSDKAAWNRVRVIPFESKFSESAPETYEEQLRQKCFPRIKNYEYRIPSMIEAFAWVLLQHRTKNSTFNEPEKVRIATEIYHKQNDIYKQFIEESIIEDEYANITLSHLYNAFKEWFRESLPGNTIPIKSNAEEYFLRLWGNSVEGKKWIGYRLRTMQDCIIMNNKDLKEY